MLKIAYTYMCGYKMKMNHNIIFYLYRVYGTERSLYLSNSKITSFKEIHKIENGHVHFFRFIREKKNSSYMCIIFCAPIIAFLILSHQECLNPNV